jgi:hypothetical protein
MRDESKRKSMTSILPFLRFYCWSCLVLLGLASCTTDTEAPVLRLYGLDSVMIPRGTSFNDPGVLAFDSKDLDLKDEVVVSGDLNEAVVGTYERFYTVTDEAGNSSQIKRKISVYHGLQSADGQWSSQNTCFDCGGLGSGTATMVGVVNYGYIRVSPSLGGGNSSYFILNISPSGNLILNNGVGCIYNYPTGFGTITADADSISLSVTRTGTNGQYACSVLYVRLP